MASRARAVLNDDGVTEQEAVFADEYLVDWNGKYAAIRSGVGANYAANWASKALRNPRVKALIERNVAVRKRRIQNMQDKVVRELAALAFSRHKDYQVDDSGRVTLNGQALEDDSDEQATAHAAIKSIKRETRYERDPDDPENVTAVYEVKYELWDKNTALRNLGVHMGMFIERSAAASNGDAPDGAKTVWDFGGQKIEF